MSVFDIKGMAQGFFLATEQHPKFKETMALRMVETAVEIINDAGNADTLLNNITCAYEHEFGMNRVDDQIVGLVDTIRKDMLSKGWDPRTKVKLEERKLSNTYHRVAITMDLEATVKSFNDAVRKKMQRRATSVPLADIVSDNPGAELINELDRVISKQSERRTPLLSDRGWKSVRNDKERDSWS